MTIKECILDNRECNNIILMADEITSVAYFKENRKATLSSSPRNYHKYIIQKKITF